MILEQYTLDESFISKERYRKTNSIWNQKRLNSISSVGCLTELINRQEWKGKEYWEQYYFENGRTKEQLSAVAEKLHALLPDYTLRECKYIVYYRVICETWNGYARENNVIENWQKVCPDLKYKKTSGQVDTKLSVDYEVFKDDVLICGVQIKPYSYSANTNYLTQAKMINKEKNNQYKQQTGKDVITVLVEQDGSKWERYNY